MDPKLYVWFRLPDFGGVFLPWRYWSPPMSWCGMDRIEGWAENPHVIGVA